MKVLHVILLFWLCCLAADTDAQVSIATDAAILRNLNPHQKFWAFGQTVLGNFHISKKETGYAWLSYFTNGKFSNRLDAVAKDAVTSPQKINYTIQSSLRYRQVSVGWKHYFKGSFDEENGWSIYSLAGFGLLFGKAENIFSQPIDSSRYFISNPMGSGNFRRLTFDLGAGTEFPLGGDVYVYSELRSWLPTYGYPSPYLYSNSKIPSVLSVHAGLRVLMQ